MFRGSYGLQLKKSSKNTTRRNPAVLEARKGGLRPDMNHKGQKTHGALRFDEKMMRLN